MESGVIGFVENPRRKHVETASKSTRRRINWFGLSVREMREKRRLLVKIKGAKTV